MRNLYNSLVACCVALACGACMNPAPTPADDAASAERAMIAAKCAAAPPRAAKPPALQNEVAYAPATAAPARLGACRGASPPADASCERERSGWYALAYDLDVVYRDEAADGEPAYDPGRAPLRVLFKAALHGTCDGEAPVLSSLQVCGLTLPPLASAADGGWQALTIPNEAWDRPTEPRFETRVRASEGMDMDPTRVLLGIEPSEQWPGFLDTPSFDCGEQRHGSACFPDQDDDGEPGITVQLPQATAAADCGDWHLAGARTERTAWVGPRASRLYLGLRTQLSGNFAFADGCEGGVGNADAQDVALRVLDCELDSGGRCNAVQATYVDQHAPVFQVLHAGESPTTRMPPSAAAELDLRPSDGPRLTAKRLGSADDGATCQDVRSALGLAPGPNM